MPLQKRVANAWLFPNGMLAATDAGGEQIGELQGAYSIEKHKRILLEALSDCQLKGFDALPLEWLATIHNWLQHFRNQNLSWEEINSL